MKLYRKGTQHKFQGIMVDAINVPDDEVEAYKADGWGNPWDILKADKIDEADTNESGKLSTDEIRQAAKDAGIDGWEKKRIKTLKAELGIN